jgi:hypothetical protein
MDDRVKYIRLGLAFLFATVLIFYACSDRQTVTDKSFVGKWKSSRVETPVYLYNNGEWEIKTEDGAILQYGVWEFKSDKIIWSYQADPNTGRIERDVNDVLSATPREFQLVERDGSNTIFKRLD